MYVENILKTSDRYLKRHFSSSQLLAFRNSIDYLKNISNTDEVVTKFIDEYNLFVKQSVTKSLDSQNKKLNHFVQRNSQKVKTIWGDCLHVLQQLQDNSVNLMVTSPPYYNVRDYSQWKNLDDYLSNMQDVIQECYRVLENHRAFVFNVGDIFDNDNLHTRSSWGKRRIPLGAYFTNIFEKAGFRFVDDFIWDKGEVESQRHKNGNMPYPLYQYPINCYEHILVFYKHQRDELPYPCPICGCLKVNGNAYSGIGIKSWECKNHQCFQRSKSNRGKRFSARSQKMNSLKTDENIVREDLIKKWRRDIIKINPVIKINSRGKNTLGHTAPFPKDIPEYAVNILSGKGEVVLDMFAGSFTTPIEAQKYNRIGIGIELNKATFRDAILKNIKNNGLAAEELNV